MKSHYFVALFSCLLAGCGGSAMPSQTFHLNVKTDHGNNDHRQEAMVAFHVPPKAEISVRTGQDLNSIALDGMKSDVNRECVVRLVAERQEGQTDGPSKVEILVRIETPYGASAGGPSIYKLDDDKPLKSLLDVTVAEGDFALDQPVTLGTSNGVPITLVVRRGRDS